MVSQTVTPSPLIAPFTATGSAPCKINLTLDVLAPRPDGFHDLSSLVVPMAYPADTVTVSVKHGSPHDSTQITLSCDDPTLPTDEKNLAFRAARDFARAFLPAQGLAIHVDLVKRLPHQAGLGGGSSDAATALRLLARNCLGHRLDENRTNLKNIASKIGSDVPLFLTGGPVEMSGRGESITPLHGSLPPIYGVLVKPSVGVPTGPAYALLDALPSRQGDLARFRRTEGAGHIKLAVSGWQGKTLRGAEDFGPLLHNDFEAAILPAYPEVERAHQAVQEAGAVRALLCGSGSAIFGLARERDHAKQMSSVLKENWPWVAETSTLADSEPNKKTGTSADA